MNSELFPQDNESKERRNRRLYRPLAVVALGIATALAGGYETNNSPGEQPATSSSISPEIYDISR